ncbi:MAG: hypothetical protein ACP5ON_10300, partial [Bacteroidota bacterium]
MRVAEIFISLIISAFVLSVASSQEKSAGTARATSIDPCCDSGQLDGFFCDDTTVTILVRDPGTGECRDRKITLRECVEVTGDRLTQPCSGPVDADCGVFTGVRYCSDIKQQNGYPRYYAWTPIKVEPSSLTFTAQYGGSNPSSQAFLILNGVSCIDYTLHWNTSEGANWLSLSPTSGTVSGTDGAWVNASVN